MMIEIDSITGLEEARQASDIRQLVKREKDWLRVARPDTLSRHRKFKSSIATLTRTVLDDNLSIHIPRRDGVAIGLATIVHSITLKHPLEEVEVAGREIDYWGDASVTDEEHVAIATQLARVDDYEGTVLGLLTKAEAERARGIPLTMEAVGKPSWIEVPAPDRYKISCIPDLQLYKTEV